MAAKISGVKGVRDDMKTEERFIELRAEGLSYAKIAAALNMPRAALIDWGENFQEEIANAKTIYQTNLSSIYNAGKLDFQMMTGEAFPYLMYSATVDPSTRTTHRIMNGFIALNSDPIWNTIYPVNGFGCRCSIKSLSAEEAKKCGGPSPHSMIPEGFPDEGFDHAPILTGFEPRESEGDQAIWEAPMGFVAGISLRDFVHIVNSPTFKDWAEYEGEEVARVKPEVWQKIRDFVARRGQK